MTWIVGHKAQTTPAKYEHASMRIMDTENKNGKERPFNYGTAVRTFRGWVYAAVFMNAKAMAGVPLRLYVRKNGAAKKLFRTRAKVNYRQRRYMLGDNKRHASSHVIQKTQEWGEEFEVVTEKHPILELLSNPNEYTRGFEFACMRHMMASLTGNFYMHPVVESARSGGESLSRVKELWCMPSQYVKIVPGKDNFVESYMYGVDSQVIRRFSPEEVMHMKFPNPSDMLYGLGQVESDWGAIRLTNAQRETDQAKYDNQARPDLAIITKSASVTIDKLKELQQEWNQNFKGTFRAGAPVFLTGDTQVVPLNWMPTEQGSREIVIEEHAAVFGVPVSLLKANDPNLASAQVGFASWRENTIAPYCKMDEEFLNYCLLPHFRIEDDAFLCYDDPVPENRDEIRQDINTYMQHGVATRNEVRQMLGDEEINEPNADVLLVPTGLVPIDKAGEPPPSLSAGAGGPNSEDNNDRAKRFNSIDSTSRELGKISTRLSKTNIVRQSEPHSHTEKGFGKEDTQREGEKEKPIREMTKSLNRIFAMQRRDCVAVLTGRKSDNPIVDVQAILHELLKYNDAISDAVAPQMEKQLVDGAKAGYEAINLPEGTFDLVNPKVAEFVRHYTVKLAGEVNRFTAEKLSETLGDGLDAGESTGQLASRVNELFDDFEGYRSEMIARTESARAFVSGTAEAWKESGVVQGKKWRLASAACPICSVIAGTFPKGIPLGEEFYPLGSQIALPGGKFFAVDYTAIKGPPAHPHCRCGIQPVMMEDE